MSTRSITTFFDTDGNGKPERLCTIYRHFDGYPAGNGAELFEFLTTKTVVNGTGAEHTADKYANGAGCLAAQFIQHIKAKYPLGNVYMARPRVQLQNEDYGYEVFVLANGCVRVEVRGISGKIFKGSVAAFGHFCKQ